MKNCPYCKAQIEDNARFCLYCMKTLTPKEEVSVGKRKKPWWGLVVITGILAAAVAVILSIPGCLAEESPIDRTEEQPLSSLETQQQTEASTESNEETTENPTSLQPVESVQMPEQNEEEIQSSVTEEVTQQQPAETPAQPSATEATTQPETTEETTPSRAEVAYTYRKAQAGDDFSAMYQNGGNDIVITGVAAPAANGVYDIPEYIDGQKVIAISEGAFYGSNAREVYVPATLRTIWDHAFNGCPLTDIYFRGKAIYMSPFAFKTLTSGSVTIHCAEDCHDRDFRFYKNSAAQYYDAVWEEWDG